MFLVVRLHRAFPSIPTTLPQLAYQDLRVLQTHREPTQHLIAIAQILPTVPRLNVSSSLPEGRLGILMTLIEMVMVSHVSGARS